MPKGQNPEELGRLVVDINTISTVRRVAVREFLEFRRFGTYIRLHGHQLDEASRAFNAILDNDLIDIEDWTKKFIESGFKLKNLPKLAPVSVHGKTRTVKRLTKDTRSLQNKLCRLEAEIYEHSSKFTGGMQFRVSRSRYYAQQFRDRLGALAIVGIEGFQSYPLFIRRRVEPLFAYISDVGGRATGLRERLSSILSAIQSKTLVDLTKNIEILNEFIAGQAATGETQARIILFLTIFVTVSEVIHAVAWNNLENIKELSVSSIVISAENEIQQKATYVFKCTDRYVSHYWKGSVPEATTDRLGCEPQEFVSPQQDSKNNEAKSAAFSHTVAFLIAVCAITVVFLIRRVLKLISKAGMFIYKLVRLLFRGPKPGRVTGNGEGPWMSP